MCVGDCVLVRSSRSQPVIGDKGKVGHGVFLLSLSIIARCFLCAVLWLCAVNKMSETGGGN